MDEQTRLELLKRELMAAGSSIYDALLKMQLKSAEKAIQIEGIELDLENEAFDNQLVIGYAAWLFRQRENPEMPMPKWLRWNLNNKLFSQHARKGMAND